MAHWKYDFDCSRCDQIRHVKDKIRNGNYCIPIMTGMPNIHADDDRVVRCDSYRPKMEQISFFEGGE